MSYTLQDFISEARSLAQTGPWCDANEVFWNAMQSGQLEPNQLRALLEELTYLQERAIDFDSAVLHVNIHEQVLFALSSDYVAISTLNLSALDVYRGQLPVPAVEGLCNLLLVMAETDVAAFLTAKAVLSEALRTEDLRRGFEQAGLAEELKVPLNKFMNILEQAPATVEKCLPYFNSFGERDRVRVMNQLHVMFETIELAFEEIALAAAKWSPLRA